MKKLLSSLALASIVSLTVVGCSDTQTGEDAQNKVEDAGNDAKDTANQAKDAADDAADKAEDSIREMSYEDIKITPEQAFDKFMELHPEAKVRAIDLDKELREYQYVIEGYDEENNYEVKVNPVDGEMISDDAEAVDSADQNAEITKDQLAKVDSIIDKAKAEDGSKSELDEWNISVENGKVVMDVEIGMTQYSYDMETEELIQNNN